MMWYILLLLLHPGLEALPSLFEQSLTAPPSHQLALAAPASFGKTHFIIGHSDRLDRQKGAIAPSTSSVRVLFSPDDEIKNELVDLIDHEPKAISAAIFILTEPTIAQALVRARKRGVAVEIVTDVGCLKERANKINLLCDQGCKLYVYHPPSTPRYSSIMHHKFALFFSSGTLWTGSYNFTRAASGSNQENAVIISDKKVFDQFAFQFKRLKDRSYRYGKSART